MFWTHRCAMAGSLWVSIFLADGSRGDEKAGPAAAEVEAAALVRQALENEVAGDGAARDRLLGDATAIAPDYPPARWHGAHVQLGDEWMAAAEAQKRQSTNERIQEYQAKRDAAENPT